MFSLSSPSCMSLDQGLANVHSPRSPSPQSRVSSSSLSSQPLSRLTPSLLASPFVLPESLPDCWYIAEPLSDSEEYRVQPLSQQEQGPTAPSPLPLPPLPLPPSSQASSLHASPHSSDAVTMSAAVALQFDPLFGMGSRPLYSWTASDSNSGLLSPDLHAYSSDISLSPPTASRSVTASPPRYPIGLTAEQREIKRQRDQARREAKFASRRRTGSGEQPAVIDAVASYSTPAPHSSAPPLPSARSSVDLPVLSASSRSSISASSPAPYMQSPAITMANMSSVSSANALPVAYTTASAPPMPLLSEPAGTSAASASLTSPSYLTPAAPYSPPLQSHASQDVFPQPYQPQPYLPDYTTTNYSHSPAIHSQYPRVQEQSMLYQMPQLPPPSVHSMMHGSLHPQQQPPHGHQQLPHLSSHPHHAHPHGIHGLPPVASPDDAIPSGVRVVQSRPKPQCWEHGCNGRQFSTFSNLLRHQREKSGQAAKAICPNCGAEFTRTTARNGHLAHDKCKPRRNT